MSACSSLLLICIVVPLCVLLFSAHVIECKADFPLGVVYFSCNFSFHLEVCFPRCFVLLVKEQISHFRIVPISELNIISSPNPQPLVLFLLLQENYRLMVYYACLVLICQFLNAFSPNATKYSCTVVNTTSGGREREESQPFLFLISGTQYNGHSSS